MSMNKYLRILIIFALLCSAHCVGDKTLQTGYLSQHKREIVNGTTNPDWYKYLTIHAAVNGFCILAVTQDWESSVGEFVAHWLIDRYKCLEGYSTTVDQSLHFICLLSWLFIYCKKRRLIK